MSRITQGKPDDAKEVILSRALDRAANYWGLTNKQLGEICGISESSVSRLKNSQYVLDINSKQWQLAVIFLRIFRGLDSYMGGNIENEKAWLKAENEALGGIPLELMSNVEGLAGVVQYVDYIRGH